jgi:uncharacterized protein YciI
VQYVVYGRDRPGSLEIKVRCAEEHWTYMDGFADRMIARGPTLTSGDDDAEPTGSLHIVELPDVDSARVFAHEDPYFRADAFASVEVYGFRNLTRRTMWDFTGAVAGLGRYLLIARGRPPAVPLDSPHLIVGGELLDPDDGTALGAAALVEATGPDAASAMLGSPSTEVHHWRFGGRPDPEA